MGSLDIVIMKSLPSFRYLNEAIKCNCFSDLMKNRMLPNAKEVSESFAAYAAVRKHLSDIIPFNEPALLIAVGDGSTPRTAATFAFRSAWTCLSVDPRLRQREWPIKRLQCLSKRIEDTTRCHVPRAIIVAVHSHAPLRLAIEKVSADILGIVAIPCCKKQIVPGIEPNIEYDDLGIMSPKRTVKVWRIAKRVPYTHALTAPSTHSII